MARDPFSEPSADLLQFVIGIDHLRAGRGQTQLRFEAQPVGVEQVGQDGQLFEVAVLHDAVVLFGLANGQFKGPDPFDRLLVAQEGRALRLPPKTATPGKKMEQPRIGSNG